MPRPFAEDGRRRSARCARCASGRAADPVGAARRTRRRTSPRSGGDAGWLRRMQPKPPRRRAFIGFGLGSGGPWRGLLRDPGRPHRRSPKGRRPGEGRRRRLRSGPENGPPMPAHSRCDLRDEAGSRRRHGPSGRWRASSRPPCDPRAGRRIPPLRRSPRIRGEPFRDRIMPFPRLPARHARAQVGDFVGLEHVPRVCASGGSPARRLAILRAAQGPVSRACRRDVGPAGGRALCGVQPPRAAERRAQWRAVVAPVVRSWAADTS